MLSICIVIASIAAAAYLIFKKYYAPGALLFVGLITLGVVACISPDPLITGKKATHLAGLDVIQIFWNRNIMCHKNLLLMCVKYRLADCTGSQNCKN